MASSFTSFSDARIQDPINVAIGGNEVKIPIHLGDDGKSIVLNYGSQFNITYEDQSTISLCKVTKQSSEFFLRSGFDASLRHSKENNDHEKDLLT